MVSRIPEDPNAPPPPPHEDRDHEVYVLGREAVRAVDRLATAQYAIPSIILMENAAIHVAEIALQLLGQAPSPGILILCGPGNNGGDGLAAARHLHNAGARLELILAAPDAVYSGDAATNLRIARAMGLSITTLEASHADAALRQALERLGRADLIIDALLGTGLTADVREPVLSLINAVNRAAREQHVQVLAVDIPSGLDCDTGEPHGAAIHADVTVSLVGLKAGFTTLSAQSFIGDVIVVDIGAPRELTSRLGLLLKDQELPDRPHPHPTPEEAKRRGDG